MEARQAEIVQVLADTREEEEVDRFVDERRVLALDEQAAGLPVEHRDGLTEVVDDRVPSR